MEILFINNKTNIIHTYINNKQKSLIDIIIHDIYFLCFPMWQINEIEEWEEGNIDISKINSERNGNHVTYKDYLIDEWELIGITKQKLKKILLSEPNKNINILNIQIHE